VSYKIFDEEVEELIESDVSKAVDLILSRVQRVYGAVPLVHRFLAKRPEVFIPYIKLFAQVLLKPKHLSRRDVELIALSASIALRCRPCIEAHVEGALRAGASKEEVVEAMLVAASIAQASSLGEGFRALMSVGAEEPTSQPWLKPRNSAGIGST